VKLASSSSTGCSRIGLGTQKNVKRFAGFDAAVATDLRTSLELFLDEVMRADGADFASCSETSSLLNGRLAQFYGVKLPASAPFEPVTLNPEQRAACSRIPISCKPSPTRAAAPRFIEAYLFHAGISA